MGVSYNQGPVVPAQAKFTGSDVLQTGFALAHDIAQTDGSQEFSVAKPATANLAVPFGIVSPDSNNKQGPCLTEVFRDGSICQAYVKANCTTGVTKLKLVNGQYYLQLATASVAGTTVGDDYVATALQTIDTSTTAGLVLVSLGRGKA